MIINFYAHNDGFKEELIYIINSSTVLDKGDVIKINNSDYIVNKREHDLFSNNSKTII